MEDLAIEYRDIDSVRPYWRNPRLNDRTIGPLKESITRYGFKVPIIVDKDSVIITGHARYKAARELGMARIPVIVTDMTEEKAKEFRIVDNKVPESTGWDDVMLTLELRELDLDEMQTFFTEDLGNLVAESVGSAIKPFEDKDIERAEGKTLDKQLTQAERSQDYTTVCPHCGNEFSFSL